MKRFHVTGVARDKEYDLTQGKPGSKVVYFTANPNGEAEIIRVALKPQLHLKKVEVLKDLSELAVKNRGAMGNVLTKFEVKSITLKQKGHSTLGGRKVWFDADVLRVNYDEQGTYLGEFDDDDRILVITTEGNYYLNNFDPTAHFDNNILRIEKWQPDKVWSLAMWNDELQFYYGKRFTLSDALAKPQSLLGEAPGHKIIILSDREEAAFQLQFTDANRPAQDVIMADFIDVKSAKARGKRLSNYDIANIIDITPEPPEPEQEPETPDTSDQPDGQPEMSTPGATDAPSAGAKDAADDSPSSIPFTITNGESDVQLSLDL
jgi:topoisomerase-4 subunit A